MKALSIREPWASAILLGKDVENRSRYSRYRGPLLIHASLKIDRHGLSDPRIAKLMPNLEISALGHLIGVVTLVDCVRVSKSRWANADSEWKLILENPRALLRPIPYRGQIAMFEVDHELLRGLLPVGFEQELPPGMLALR